ncbi:flavin reductase family protein [Vibrio hangzhouensis]|uniref:NADH-FMN oxidoreductase RutF, flavin reductase (DIM6/NTAB) family n=1 Tax=Vibrio hangzhouensis TaxID=462991 RepID=A0A1H5V4A9_9VIBR|nr:flavin reductase family protein [Vibrio hangzhouensis]SEF82215.1 NADH-FMN oxidoreductase RutF, flavin reductase (DIM6/NTAB) family [Vibrio hangzhouensis]
MLINLEDLSATSIYHLMTQTVIPRPIAWVLTESASDNYNLAPFSYFAPISSNPPLLMISVGKKPDGTLKDTAVNAINNRKLVIHIASVDSADVMTQTSATLSHGESEVQHSQVALNKFEGFSLPKVAECPIAFGCTLHEVVEMGKTPQHLLIAQIEQVYIDDSVVEINNERLLVDALKVNPLSRLGGSDYATLAKTFTIKRPQ